MISAILSGVLTALAFPKSGVAILAWISLIPLLHAIVKSRGRAGFRLSFVAGLFFFGVLLYWIPSVPAHYGGMPVWLCILIYVLLIAFLSLFWGLFGLLFDGIRRVYPVGAFLLAPLLWVGCEFLMTHVFTGFPWGILGTSQHVNLPLLQTASVAGVYGISFLLVLLQSAFVLAATRKKAKSPFFAAVTLFVLAHAWGYFELRNGDYRGPEGLKASVIQGNVSSDIYWDAVSYEEVRKLFDRHLELTRMAMGAGSELIIWPEFTVPLCFSCEEEPYREFRAEIEQLVGNGRSTLLLGTNETTGTPARRFYFNTAMALHPDLSRTLYAKMHLVPFGEYTPYKKIFFFIEKMTHAIGDITPGTEPVLHVQRGFRFASPICYEIIFPKLVRSFVRKGADFLVTITNDGWYGTSSAPYQHWAQAVLRAVENRRYLLRAATTGVSGFVDPYGRVLQNTRLMTRAFLTETVYPSPRLSVYARIGDVLPLAGLTLGAIFFILALLNPSKERRTHGRHRDII